MTGQTFLSGALSSALIAVEAAFGADLTAASSTWTWADITADVRQADGRAVAISPMGRSDETSQSQPAGCTFELNNSTGAYTSFYPGSTHFPNVRRNTPIRVRLFVSGAWYVRFQGYANGWVPEWDDAAKLAIIIVSASGILRKLQQGKSPLSPALSRAVMATSPIGYWPLTDGTSAFTAANAISSGPPMVPWPTAPKFAATVGPAGATDPVPDWSGGGALNVPGLSTVASTPYSFAIAVKVPTIPSGQSLLLARLYSFAGTVWYIDLGVKDNAGGGVYLTGNNGAIFTANGNTGIDDGKWHWVKFDASQAGSDIVFDIYVDGVLSSSGALTVTGQTIGPPNDILLGLAQPNGLYPTMGHVVLWNGATVADLSSAMTGHSGETVTARLTRLCSEEGVPLTLSGSSTMMMGTQTTDTFINLIRECETTDDGLLLDGLNAGLTYIPRENRYNLTATLSPDMSASPPQVGIPFAPADDDQRNRNSVKVDRKNGSSAVYEDTSGVLGTAAIGTYDSSITVNTVDDSGLLSRASWEVHKGTVVGYRYPALALDLHATPTLAAAWLGTAISNRIDVLNVTSKATQHPPGTVSLLLEGYTETLSPFDWQVTANCSLYNPWRVAVVASATDTLWRVDSAASTVHTSASAGATSLSVTVSDGFLWTTAAGDYPLSIDVGGIQVTVTAVSGASSPQTFTVSALPYAVTAGWQVSLWRPPTIAL